MPRIVRAAWRPFRIPFREEFRASHGVLAAREGFVLLLEDDQGQRGLGEAAPLASFSGETLSGLEAAFEALPERPAGGSARFAFDVALAGLRDAAAGDPKPETLDPVRVPVNALIGDTTPEAAAGEALERVGEGFRTLKLKVGRERQRDRARVAAVRDAVGPSVALRLDANGAWSLGEARGRLKELAQFGIELCEQPVAPGPDAFAQMRRLREETGVRIAADESLIGVPFASVPCGAVDAFVVKPAVLGLDAARVFVEQPAVPVIVTTTFDTGIGTAAAMRLAAGLREPRPACGLDTLRFLEGDIVRGVPPLVDGHVTLSNAPGQGVELDEAALERYATGPWREVRL